MLACNKYEDVVLSTRASGEHREKILLALLIKQYEETNITLAEEESIELIRIRMEDLNYKSNEPVRRFNSNRRK